MMRKITICLLCIAFMCFMVGCETTTSFEDESGGDSADPTGVTESGNEYTAYVDQDALSCSVTYLGSQIDIDEAELNDEDMESEYLVLHLTYWNELDLISHDSDVDDLENKDSLERSFVFQAVQGDKVIEPRDEIDAETFEEENTYELIDAGDSIECEYWFPVNASEPVKVQILNPDGEDTVMAELEYMPRELMDDF